MCTHEMKRDAFVFRVDAADGLLLAILIVALGQAGVEACEFAFHGGAGARRPGGSSRTTDGR